MHSDPFDVIIMNAINQFLKKSKENTFEITSALATKTIPNGLIDAIKQGLKEQENTEKNRALKKLYKEQLEYKRTIISTLTLEGAKLRWEKDKAEFNQFQEKIRSLQAEVVVCANNFETGLLPGDLEQEQISPNKQRDYFLSEIETVNEKFQEVLIQLLNLLYTDNGEGRFTHSELAPLLLNSLSVKTHWAKEVKSLHNQIDNLRINRDLVGAEKRKLDFVLNQDTDKADYVQMKQALFPENLKKFKKQAAVIKTEYAFNRFSVSDHAIVLNRFVKALAPLSTDNLKLSLAVEAFEKPARTKKDILQRKITILNLLNDVLADLRAQHKINRVNELKKRIVSVEINEHTTNAHLALIINDWRVEPVNGKRNFEVFQPNALYRFFHFQPSKESLFINQCLTIADTNYSPVEQSSFPVKKGGMHDKEPLLGTSLVELI